MKLSGGSRNGTLFEDLLRSADEKFGTEELEVDAIVPWAEKHILLPEGKLIQFMPHQKQILEHVFTFNEHGKLPYSVIVYSCPKKSGKTALSAVVMCWWAFNIEAPNEIICVANKRDQAVARGYREVQRHIERNPVLASQVVRMGDRGIELKNGTTIIAIPNDFAGEAGSNHGLTSWDELWGFTTERDHRLYDELTPVPTRKNSIRLITTYAGFEGESKLLEDLYHKIFDARHEVVEGIARPLGEDFPAYSLGELFVYWDREARMPWQTPEYYESQRVSLRRNTYLRLHENQWVSSESGLFDMDKFDLCTDPNHRPPLPSKNVFLYVGVDASVKKDRSAVVSVYEDEGRLKLGPKRFWQPSKEDPMDLEETMEAYLLDLYHGYSLLSVRFDPFQFHRSAMTLQKKGLPMVEFPQTTSNLTSIGQNLFDLIEYGNLVLYPCRDLRFEATCAIAKETGRGLQIRKEKSSQKIDQIVALAMACLRLNQGFFEGYDLS
jgi:phage terminase large subunit-like protein